MHSIEGFHLLGLFGAFALGGGIALYIAGTAFIWRSRKDPHEPRGERGGAEA